MGGGLRWGLLCYSYLMDTKYLRARNLRKNLTQQERKLWNILRNKQFHNLSFRRQHPIGNYIVDFICRSQKLIIELDGGQHNIDENIRYDKERTIFLENLGFKVIRFWNNDIDNNIEGVIKFIEENINQPSP